MSTPSTSSEAAQRAARLEKVRHLQEQGILPYAYSFPVTHLAAELQAQFADLEPGGEREDVQVAVAGRIRARRVMGKLAFLTLQDRSGTIQLYLEKQRLTERMGEVAFKNLDKLIDVGDWLGARGCLKRTEKGELSVWVDEYQILTKALLPLPDKWHGLRDVEKRYRQRYVDLIVNPEVKQTLLDRAKIIRSLRQTLEARGFVEIETPVLQVIPGGAEARPFVTHHNALNLDLYLRIATELHLKRLVVGGSSGFTKLGGSFAMRGSPPATTRNLPPWRPTKPLLTITR